MNDSLKKRGIKVNVGKTKVMLFDRSENIPECDILIDGGKIEQIDIERRVNARNEVNGVLLAITNTKSVSQQVGLAIHNVVLIPTLMYGSESWVWQKKNESRINAVEMQSRHNICGVSRKDICRNSYLREWCDLKGDVVTRVEKDGESDRAGRQRERDRNSRLLYSTAVEYSLYEAPGLRTTSTYVSCQQGTSSEIADSHIHQVQGALKQPRLFGSTYVSCQQGILRKLPTVTSTRVQER
ncbi:hypothetical protein EVAR_11154_1 [Eumeta japonica]|uniref:Reverse transcriptase domain-containing protein n=1 Tax=Eumeta variegata TaxID=151549 RepID=A0A4C1U407_EUMVA|nr:hypothetical protein EVAR_11154_1 [Eumeta japonica]